MENHEEKQLQQFDEEKYVPREDTISLLDLIGVLARRWKLILVTTLTAAVLIVAFSVYTLKIPADSPLNPMPNIYAPTAKVLLQDTTSSSNGLQSLLQGSNASSLANLLGVSSTAGQTNAALAQALLTENTIVDQIVKEFDITKRYGITKDPKTKSRAAVTKNLDTTFDQTTGILDISFNSIDPVFATKVVNRMVDLLEARFKNLTMEKVLSKKQFLEQRIAEVEKQLKDAENNLVAFQNKYGIVDVSVQTTASVQRMAGYQNQLLQAEFDLQNLLEYNQPNSAAVQRKQNDIAQLKKLIGELKGGFSTYSANTIPQDKIAELGVQYQNLQSDVQLQMTIDTTLQQQYEATKIEEANNAKTFQIIEHAEVPELKDHPSRGKISVIVTITAFFLAVFAAFILEYFERVKQDPIESRKLSSIKRVLGRQRHKGEE